MTNDVQIIKIVCDCTPSWPFIVLRLLPVIALATNLCLLVRGLRLRRRNGSAVPCARGALIASLGFLALGLCALLNALARILFSFYKNEFGHAQIAMWATTFAEDLVWFSWLLLPVTLGFVAACILGTAKAVPAATAAGQKSSRDSKTAESNP
jgi:hypothetical protein